MVKQREQMMMENPELRWKGALSFQCNDQRMNEGFQWAKEQALAYAHEGDPVGSWYEAALPNREAFCMRDVSHHIDGAQALGLASHSKNMLLRFAQGISESRDFCSFWEIDRNYRPAPADYRSDADFWYNLPANFDMLDACRRAFCWTGDLDYLNSYDFQNFYRLSTTKYVERWDADGDGMLERTFVNSRRGIPSYNEQSGISAARSMLDLHCVQALGYRSYSFLCQVKGELELAEDYSRKAKEILEHINTVWWDEKAGAYYLIEYQDQTLGHDDNVSGVTTAPLYYHGVLGEQRIRQELLKLNQSEKLSVEGLSHMPDIFYHYGAVEEGYRWLLQLVDPKLYRREYPEASFCAVGSIASELMGVNCDASTRTVSTLDGRPKGMGFAQLENMPVLDGTVQVRHEGNTTTLENQTQGEILWDVGFYGEFSAFSTSASKHWLPRAIHKKDAAGHFISHAVLSVKRGQKISVTAVE